MEGTAPGRERMVRQKAGEGAGPADIIIIVGEIFQ